LFIISLEIISYIDCEIEPRTRKLISTGISISWEGTDWSKYYLRVAPRSGLSVKNNIDIGAGVIDSDYRGEIFICFINNSNDKVYNIKKGEDTKIQAQIDAETASESAIDIAEDSGKLQ
jgi:dUTP pyrophosphatase